MPGLADDIGKLTPHLRRFARALVRGHAAAAADDLVQEMVLLAARSDIGKGGAGLSVWCHAALVRLNRVRDRATPSEGENALPFLPKEILRLDALPLESREVLLLVSLAGLSYGQVADALAVDPAEMFARLTRARDLLLKAGDGGAAARRSIQRARAAPAKPHLRLIK